MFLRLSPIGLAAAALIGLFFAAPASAATSCGTLNGYYGMQVNGTTPSGTPKFINGVMFFSGSCSLIANATIGENGTVNPFATITGSYTPNADNTITLTLQVPGNSANETYDIAFTPIFSEALGIETDSSAVASIDLKNQIYPTSGFHNIYNVSTLKGTFVANCGYGTGYSDLNYFTFDGNGNVTAGTDHYNNNASFGIQSYTGAYGVNPIGDFGGYVLLSSGAEFGFSGALDNNLNEIQFVYSTAGSNGSDVVSCVGKRVQ
jgi:hypothetical protein